MLTGTLLSETLSVRDPIPRHLASGTLAALLRGVLA